MHEVVSQGEWITTELAEYCLKTGGLINKLFTGNGFTFASSNIPNTSGKPDILIVPNIATARDKRGRNGRGKDGFARGKKVLYFYSGSTDKVRNDYSNIDLIVCVADSYLHKELYKVPSRYTLLDEHHTAKIQSGLRVNLYRLFEVLQHKKNVSYVTATPYINDIPDITIKNTHERFTVKKDIHVSLSHKKTMEQLKKCLSELKPNERILIASNEARKVNSVLNELEVKEVRLMVGDGFRESFFNHSTVKINNTAPITIMTTSAFEGHDVDEVNTSVFLFQNYADKHVQYLDSQIIQAFGRPRKKPKYLHLNWSGGRGGGVSATTIKYQNELEQVCDAYCKVFNKKQTKFFNNGASNDKKESFESENFLFSYKGSKIRLGAVRSFIVYDDFNFKNERKRIAKTNYIACDVLRTKLNIHKNVLNTKYYNERNYNIIQYNDLPCDLKFKPVSNSTKTKNLIHNRNINPDYISKRELVNWSFNFDKKDDFKKVYKILKEHLQEDTPPRLNKFFNVFNGFDDLFDKCNALNGGKDRKTLESNVFEIVKSFIGYGRPSKKIRGFRNFTAFTVTSPRVTEHIYKMFGLKQYVKDITACAPSVLQRLAGEPRRDVYDKGVNRKKSKKKINMYLNWIYEDVKYSEERFRELQKYNFSDKTLELLKSQFYKTGVSGLFLNTYTFYEREIIKQAVRIIDKQHLTITRHDEINVYFDDVTDDEFKRITDGYDEQLSKINCLGVNNWFGYEQKETKILDAGAVKNEPILYPKTIQYALQF